MKSRLVSTAGFTLIELLVVITIIIILAGLAVGVVPQALERANQVQCLSNARQVNLALRLFADDHDGNFPTNGPVGGSDLSPGTSAATSSNAAFRTIIPYAKQEKIFYVGKSAWCNKTVPDERFNDDTTCLAAGENDFAYILNLTNTSNPSLPVLMNGLDTSGARYVTDKTQPGGVWGGKKAIVAKVDGSAEIAVCDPTTGVPQRTNAAGSKVSIFAAGTGSDDWLTSTQTVVNPIKP